MAATGSGGSSGSSGIRLGKAFVEIGANSKGLEAGLKVIEKRMQAFGKTISGIGVSMGAVGVAITAPLALMERQFIESGSAATDMADRLNTTVETITALGYAAALAGGNLEDVEVNLGKMQKAIAAGAENGDEFFTGLLGKNIDEQLNEIADLISGIKDKTLQSAAAMEIFGKSGRKMLPFLKEGAEGIQKLRADAAKHGAIITAEEADRADRIGDSFTKMETVVSSITRKVGNVLLPDASRFEGYSDTVAEIGERIRGFIEENGEIIRIVEKVGYGLMAGGAAVAGFGQVVSGLGAALGPVKDVLMFVFSPTGAIVIGIGLMVTSLVMFEEEVGNLSITLAALGETFRIAFGGIVDALKQGEFKNAAKLVWESLKSVGEQVSLFFQQLWSDLKSEAKIAGAEIGHAIASGLRDAIAASPTGIRATLGFTDDDLKKIKDANDKRLTYAKREAMMIRDAEHAEIGDKLGHVNDDLARRAALAALPNYRPNNDAAMAVDEEGQLAAIRPIDLAMKDLERARAGAFNIMKDFSSQGSFAMSQSQLQASLGIGSNRKSDELSALEKILEADKETNKLLSKAGPILATQ